MLPLGVPAVLVRLTLGARGTVTVAVAVFVTTGPEGGVAVTEALLTTVPASTSAWVSVWLAVQVVEAPMARVVAAQVRPVTLGSVIAIALSGVWPVLVTVNV